LREFALALPGAWEDHPWEETVAKVGKKVFVFFGADLRSMSVKLADPALNAHALSLPGAEPTGYGLGAAGWVNVRVTTRTPLSLLQDFVEESYRTVAPKKLVRELDLSPRAPARGDADRRRAPARPRRPRSAPRVKGRRSPESQR
jgi:predicted DNA-binding protein (MmcQ/YjbR family)